MLPGHSYKGVQQPTMQAGRQASPAEEKTAATCQFWSVMPVLDTCLMSDHVIEADCRLVSDRTEIPGVSLVIQS